MCASYRRAVIEVRLGRRKAKVIHGALSVEGVHQVPRTRTRLRLENDSIIIEMDAEDTSSLRASLNSYLNWLSSLGSLLDEIDPDGAPET